MNDHPKHNLRLRQTVIVAVCVLAVLLFLYLLLRDRPVRLQRQPHLPHGGQPPRGRVLERPAAAR